MMMKCWLVGVAFASGVFAPAALERKITSIFNQYGSMSVEPS
jgi:hypothetical protein